MARRGILAAVAGVVMALATFGVASAHAELVSSSPANGAVLDASPSEIVLWFTEAVDPIGIRVVDASGGGVSVDAVDQLAGNQTMRVAVPDVLDDGTYIVAWQAVSADSHRIRGAFTFSVGEATATAPGVVEGLFDDDASGSTESLGLGIGRFLSYGGIAVAIGSLLLTAVLTPETLGRRRTGVVAVAASGVALCGTIVMIAAQAGLIAGSMFAWGDVADTKSGRWWVARLVVIGVVAAFAWWGRRLPRAVVVAGTVVAGIVLAGVVAAGGHGVSGEHVAVAFVATVLHVLAMAVWLGGLVWAVASLSTSSLWTTLRRFSPWALGAVVVLAVTGAINGWRQLGSFEAVVDSTYGRWLIIKLLLVTIVLLVATLNRYLLWVRERDGGEAVGVIRRTVLVELAGMGLVLMATAGLVNSAPPAVASSASTPQIRSATAVVGERIAQVELEPAVTGGTEMHVYITSPSGGLDRADKITVTATLASDDLGPFAIDTVAAGPNHVIGPNVNLPLPGEWRFDVAARFGDFEQVTFTMEIPVSQR